MLKRVFEWYQMADPDPSDETVEKRTQAVSDLIAKILDSDRKRTVYGCVSLAVSGFRPEFADNLELAEKALDSIKKFQSAFPSDFSLNALAIRACCAIALGEILSSPKIYAQYPLGAQLAASLVISATGLKLELTEHHISKVLKEVRHLASALLQKTALEARERPPIPYNQLEKISRPEQVVDFWQTAAPEISNCFEAVERQSRADREELNLLWWFLTGYSETIESSIFDALPGTAAVLCGAEVASTVIVPPLNKIRDMVSRAAEFGRKKTEIKEKPLAHFVSHWDEKVWNAIVPSESDEEQAIRDSPDIFPLSWLALRLQESHGASFWPNEFQKMTGISPNLNCRPGLIAVQILNECTSLRIEAED